MDERALTDLARRARRRAGQGVPDHEQAIDHAFLRRRDVAAGSLGGSNDDRHAREQGRAAADRAPAAAEGGRRTSTALRRRAAAALPRAGDGTAVHATGPGDAASCGSERRAAAGGWPPRHPPGVRAVLTAGALRSRTAQAAAVTRNLPPRFLAASPSRLDSARAGPRCIGSFEPVTGPESHRARPQTGVRRRWDGSSAARRMRLDPRRASTRRRRGAARIRVRDSISKAGSTRSPDASGAQTSRG